MLELCKPKRGRKPKKDVQSPDGSRKFTVRLKMGLFEKVLKVANDHDMTISEVINQALMVFIAWHDENKEPSIAPVKDKEPELLPMGIRN